MVGLVDAVAGSSGGVSEKFVWQNSSINPHMKEMRVC